MGPSPPRGHKGATSGDLGGACFGEGERHSHLQRSLRGSPEAASREGPGAGTLQFSARAGEGKLVRLSVLHSPHYTRDSLTRGARGS